MYDRKTDGKMVMSIDVEKQMCSTVDVDKRDKVILMGFILRNGRVK